MPLANLSDISLYYAQEGQGPDVLLVSGLGTDHSMWDLSKFSQRYRVTAFDNRGSGQSDVPAGPYSLEMLAQDAADLCRHLGLKRVQVVGHSMGGHVAQVLGALHQGLVERLVIACSEEKFSVISGLATSQQIALFEYAVPPEVLVRNYLPVLFDFPFLEDEDRVEAYVQGVLQHPYPMPKEGYIAQTEALRRFDTRPLLSQIACPTRVIGAENDLLTPFKNSEYLASQIPGAELRMIPNCGHAPFVENPDLFYQLILDFLTVD